MTLQEVIETRNIDFIKEYFLRNNELEYFEMIELIADTGDGEFIKECLDDKDLVTSSYDRVDLILATKDKEYIKKSIKNSKFNFSVFAQVQLVKRTKDIDFIKECLESSELDFTPSQNRELLLATEDVRYIKKSLENDKFDLDFEKDVVEASLPSVVDQMHDPDSIREFLADSELRNDKELVNHEGVIVNLILNTCDNDYVRECIENQELSLSETSKFALLALSEELELKNDEFIENVEKKLNLPNDMTIGMEIESVGENSKAIIEHFSYEEWQSKFEFDLQERGCEVISPPMISTKENSEQIYFINNILTKLGQSINDKCGGHIHIGADYLKSRQSYENLKDIYCATEKILYAVCNEKGTIPRKGIFENAVMISDDMQRIIARKSFDIVDESDLDEFLKVWKHSQFELSGRKRAYDGRSAGLNVLNVNNEKNTIEFRFPNGTLNPEMWIDNINLLGGIIAVAQELAEIQERGAKKDEEKNKLEIFEKLKSNKFGKEKLELLLDLTGLEPEEYIERYDVNIELIKDDLVMLQIFGEEKDIIGFKSSNDKINIEAIEAVAEDASAIQQQRAEEQMIKSYEKNEKIQSIDIDK